MNIKFELNTGILPSPKCTKNVISYHYNIIKKIAFMILITIEKMLSL